MISALAEFTLMLPRKPRCLTGEDALEKPFITETLTPVNAKSPTKKRGGVLTERPTLAAIEKNPLHLKTRILIASGSGDHRNIRRYQIFC